MESGNQPNNTIVDPSQFEPYIHNWYDLKAKEQSKIKEQIVENFVNMLHKLPYEYSRYAKKITDHYSD